ncbi:heavy-metal-associated domain-containing protein [Staphylococcus pseudintermedius]|uniref:HMA domain-containing protein n=1 Tax=Staphylococcus pseudintermedius TaxID=283734 RepID=A0A317YPN3_STAPS|nr:heavy metal-associated domain-containing protein [Staphylococcus pseudintermedius]EGQ0372587.1 heavy-metal-associated domain-containing protein [Staphylococcus pseudintermedius]EGQ0390942.1 heavy-metal-associated domain-containing protein [Staphylococcus pseudintermedius]EGQ1280684.1 heavy-metal-associated domain-containing protein [Staphylococcus pseudintermedius]EGQ1622331.1 heavy-metal-associated domain-containing protein [Staphylococcus pseudintermedius]EGQ1647443.1 heavy-metal-associat
MENGYVKVTQLTTEAQQQQLSDRLLRLIGVESVAIDVATQSLTLTYDTPANLNTIEKEIYDAGYPVIQSHKGV